MFGGLSDGTNGDDDRRDGHVELYGAVMDDRGLRPPTIDRLAVGRRR
jgi:hypothetical protein